jgi:TniQ protein
LPGILIRKLIVPCLQQSSTYKDRWQTVGAGKTHSHGLNGTTASPAIYACETLTQQRSLRFLTFLTWEEVFPSVGLLRLTRAWCPVCLQEWQSRGQVIYEPLLWTLRVVTQCVRHQCMLSIHCPNTECQRSAPWLVWSGRPGYCPFCCQWLGTSASISVGVDEVNTQWQRWVTEQIGTLLALAPILAVLPKRTRIHEVFEHALQQMRLEGQSSFARGLGITRTTSWGWLTRRSIPELSTLLSLCATWKISLYDCFFQDVTTLSLHPETGMPKPSKDKHQPRGRTVWNASQVQDALEVIFTNDEFPPPSLTEVARRLESTSVTLRKYHRELCDAITERYQTALVSKRQANMQRFRQEAKQAAYQIMAQGKRPTIRRLVLVLTKPGILRNPKMRDVWQEVLREIDGNA